MSSWQSLISIIARSTHSLPCRIITRRAGYALVDMHLSVGILICLLAQKPNKSPVLGELHLSFTRNLGLVTVPERPWVYQRSRITAPITAPMCNLRQMYCRHSDCRARVGVRCQEPCSLKHHLAAYSQRRGETWYEISRSYLDACPVSVVVRHMHCSFRTCEECLRRGITKFLERMQDMTGEEGSKAIRRPLLARRWNERLAAEWAVLYYPPKMDPGVSDMSKYLDVNLRPGAMAMDGRPLETLHVPVASPGDVHAREAVAALTSHLAPQSTFPGYAILGPSPDPYRLDPLAEVVIDPRLLVLTDQHGSSADSDSMAYSLDQSESVCDTVMTAYEEMPGSEFDVGVGKGQLGDMEQVIDWDQSLRVQG